MPSLEWLKQEFHYGYDSGNVLDVQPDAIRAKEESLIGGSYRRVFFEAALPYLVDGATVMELGPGRGSWTRALLQQSHVKELHTFDFQDLGVFLKPELYDGRLICHHVTDNSFSEAPDGYFDFFWSFGVLCHNEKEQISTILRNSLPKMKPGGISAHLISDWDKLESYGWPRGGIPVEFRTLPDAQIWWPRNSAKAMIEVAETSGWEVVDPDLGIVERDSIVVLRRPTK